MKRIGSYVRFNKDSNDRENVLAGIAAGGAGRRDQRRSQRKPVAMEVTLGQCLTCFGKWSIRNLSLHGAFVKGAPRPMPVGTFLDVVFRYEPRGTPVVRYVPAHVVRVESGGLALNFGRRGQVVHADLMALLCPP